MDRVCFVSSYSESLDQTSAVIHENSGTSWSETEHTRTKNTGKDAHRHTPDNTSTATHTQLKLYELGEPENVRCLADLLSSANSSRRFVGRGTASTLNCNIPWSMQLPQNFG